MPVSLVNGMIKSFCLFLLFFAFFGCKKFLPTFTKSVPKTSVPAEQVNRLSVLKDSPDFALEDLGRGDFCGSFKRGNLSFEFEAFPIEVRNVLDTAWQTMTIRSLFEGQLKGVYLAKFNEVKDVVGSQDSTNFGQSHSNGVTCQAGTNGNYVVILNKSLLSRARSKQNYDGASYNIDSRPHGYFSARGDEVVNTFVHELFHVLDFSRLKVNLKFALGTEPPTNSQISTIKEFPFGVAEADFRRRFLGLSWRDETQSHFVNPPKVNPGSRSPVAEAYNFFKFAFEKSNFFEPNAATNPWEDFASSLEFVYISKVYNFWPGVSFYSPIAPTQERFDSKALIQKSNMHREKYCLLSEWFWPGQSCIQEK
jgi:hypothetical protein